MTTRTGKVPGLKILVEGEPGTGKTYALRSAIALGMKIRIIFLDASQVSVSDMTGDVQWKHIKPPTSNWDEMSELFKVVNTMGNAALQGDTTGIRSQRQMFDIITTCKNFISDKDGKSYGDASKWGTDTILVIDGLTKLTDYAIRMAVGQKMILTQPDWGIVQNVVRKFLQELTDNLWCHFVLLCHIDRENDEVLGGTRKYPSTAGRKLAPKIPGMFDDVVMSYRKGEKFYWRTFNDDEALIKGRSVGLINDVLQDYALLINAWKKHGGVIEP